SFGQLMWLAGRPVMKRGGVQDKARVGVDSQTAFTADGTRALRGASVNSTAL
ncbi:hypothetical protein M9458_043816, partial [Cirrhinus mrigala]